MTLGVVSLLLVAAAGFALYQVWSELSQRRQEQEDFKEIAELTEIQPEDETPTLPWHDINQLQAMNPYCIGWLTIPDTAVDYPVMQSTETPQKYLHRDYYGDYSYAGVPFLDHRCFADSHNWIIYSHNMIDGSMFGCLKQYLEDGYLSTHQTIYLQTSNGLHRYEVFAVAEIHKTDAWYSFLRRATAADYDEGVRSILKKAQIHTGVVPTFGDRLLTLSTCTGGSRDGRLVILGREVPWPFLRNESER